MAPRLAAPVRANCAAFEGWQQRMAIVAPLLAAPARAARAEHARSACGALRSAGCPSSGSFSCVGSWAVARTAATPRALVIALRSRVVG
jgi:hypothetical protein